MSIPKRNILIPIIVSALCCGIIGILYDYYYCFNDDTTLAGIMSGAYAPAYRSMGIYIQYPLSLILSALYRLVPLPWYPIYIQICVFGSIALFLGAVLRLAERLYIRIFIVISGIAAIFSILLYDLVYSQYTVVAGFMAITSVFIFTLSTPRSNDTPDIRSITACSLLYVNAFCLRREIALLLLPFFAVGIIIILQNRQSEFTKAFVRSKLVTLLIIGIGILICALAQKIAYSGADWSAYTEYNKARTQVYDYSGYPAYENDPALYETLGLNRNDYEVLSTYDLALNNKIDTNRLNALAGAAANPMQPREVLAAYVYQLRFCDQPYSYIALILYAILFLMFLMRGRTGLMLQPIALMAGRSLLWCYLLYKGRFPARIIHPLYLMEIAMLLAMLIYALQLEASKYLKGLERMLIMTVIVILLCLIPGVLSETTLEQHNRQEANIAYDEFLEYAEMHPSDHFFIDVYTSIHYTDKLWSPVQSEVSNYMLLGGWMLESPSFYSKLKYWGLESTPIAEALTDFDNTFLVIRDSADTKWLTDFYEVNLNTPITLDTIKVLGTYSKEPIRIVRIMQKAD